MLYLQLKERVTVKPGAQICVGDLADVLGEGAEDAQNTPMNLPLPPGVWKVPPTALIQALSAREKALIFLGADQVIVHVSAEKEKKWPRLRMAIVFLLLFLGSALAITWFHADVGMQDAQQRFFYLISGRAAPSPWVMTIPYALGVSLGVGLYYGLLSRKKNASPLDMKLAEYCQKAEHTAGRIP